MHILYNDFFFCFRISPEGMKSPIMRKVSAEWVSWNTPMWHLNHWYSLQILNKAQTFRNNDVRDMMYEYNHANSHLCFHSCVILWTFWACSFHQGGRINVPGVHYRRDEWDLNARPLLWQVWEDFSFVGRVFVPLFVRWTYLMKSFQGTEESIWTSHWYEQTSIRWGEDLTFNLMLLYKVI